MDRKELEKEVTRRLRELRAKMEVEWEDQRKDMQTDARDSIFRAAIAAGVIGVAVGATLVGMFFK